MTGVCGPVEHIVEFPKILIICAMIIAHGVKSRPSAPSGPDRDKST